MNFDRIIRTTCLIVLLTISGSYAAVAAGLDSARAPYRPLDTLWHDVKATVTDAGLLFGRPLRFGSQDWLLTGGVMGGTAMLMSVDESLRDEMLSARGTDGDRAMDAAKQFGERIPALVVAGSIYTTGLVFDSPKIRVMGRHVVQSLAYSALVTTVLKATFARHRPFLNEGAYVFDGPFATIDPHFSFPSGHATVAFAVASSLAADIENPWATVGLYSLATLTALSRMYHDRHWGSDVFLAAALASAIGYGTANLHDVDGGSDGTSFNVMPAPNGIALVWTW